MRTFIFLCSLALPAQADMQTARDSFTKGQFPQAIENLIPTANAGNAEAEFLLGNIYTLGLGVPKDVTRGFEFYHPAASKGHPSAQLRLSRAYATGAGTQPDRLRAYVWSRLAAIGRAQGADDQAKADQTALTPKALQKADQLIQDYRTYLYPLEK